MIARLRLFPLHAVLFPGAALNLHIFEPRYRQMIAECLSTGEGFGVALIADGAEAGDPEVTPHDVGTIAEISTAHQLPLGRYFIQTIGTERFRILEILARDPYLLVRAEILEEAPPSRMLDDLSERLKTAFEEYLALIVEYSGSELDGDTPEDPAALSFFVADALRISESIKQRLLELTETEIRLRAEIDVLERLLPQLRRVVERRRAEIELRRARGEDILHRTAPDPLLGTYFSLN